MTTQASSSQGVELQRGDGQATETFTVIAEITSFTGPSESAKQIDVTSLDSSSREYIGGLRDGGELSFDFNFVGPDTEQQGLHADIAAGTKRNFKLVLNDDATTPTEIAFAAIVTAFAIKGGVDAPVTGSCSLKLSGDPTYTYAVGA